MGRGQAKLVGKTPSLRFYRSEDIWKIRSSADDELGSGNWGQSRRYGLGWKCTKAWIMMSHVVETLIVLF